MARSMIPEGVNWSEDPYVIAHALINNHQLAARANDLDAAREMSCDVGDRDDNGNWLGINLDHDFAPLVEQANSTDIRAAMDLHDGVCVRHFNYGGNVEEGIPSNTIRRLVIRWRYVDGAIGETTLAFTRFVELMRTREINGVINQDTLIELEQDEALLTITDALRLHFGIEPDGPTTRFYPQLAWDVYHALHHLCPKMPYVGPSVEQIREALNRVGVSA